MQCRLETVGQRLRLARWHDRQHEIGSRDFGFAHRCHAGGGSALRTGGAAALETGDDTHAVFGQARGHRRTHAALRDDGNSWFAVGHHQSCDPSRSISAASASYSSRVRSESGGRT